MFDFDVGKLVMFGVVALVVIGPKDLPRAMRAAGRMLGKMRQIKSELQGQFDALVKDADADGVTKELSALSALAQIDLAANPATAMRGHSPASSAGGDAVAAAPAGRAVDEEAFASPQMKAYLLREPEPAPLDPLASASAQALSEEAARPTGATRLEAAIEAP